MSQSLKLKVDAEPTFFNKEMVIGTLLAPILGTVIGGMIGKSRMQSEKDHGRDVTDKPSFWNKDTLLGGLIGSTVASIIANVVLVAATGPAGAIAALAIFAIGTGAGIQLGGKAGEKRQLDDFHNAERQQGISNHISNAIAHEKLKGHEHSLGQGKDWQRNVNEPSQAHGAQR